MLLVFDLDGTLVDSRRDLADSANDLIAHYHGTPQSEDAIGRMVGDGAATLVRRALAASGVAANLDEALARFLAIYDTRLLHHTRPYPGLVAALEALAPLAPAAVLTNKPAAATRRILDALSLSRFFVEAIGGDGPFPRKPDPGALLHLARVYRVTPARTMLVGDSRIDWETAARAGTSVCLARYGFGYAGFPAERLTGRELAVDAAADLVDVVTKFYRANGSS